MQISYIISFLLQTEENFFSDTLIFTTQFNKIHFLCLAAENMTDENNENSGTSVWIN